ncbi:phosphotransferase [Streptomyces sp. NPDC054796]
MVSRLPLRDELRTLLGEPAKSRRLSSSPRSRVWRAELGGTLAVVKQFVDGPDADERYAREVAALRIAARVEPPVVPRLLGTDPGERVLVLEHLGHRRPARDWVVGYATSLARLHASTGRQDVGALPAWTGPTGDDITSFLALAEEMAAPVPPRVHTELEALVGRLTRTPGHSLLHGDPCPGNDLHAPDGVRFIDFEQASLGHGTVELVYPRIGFPTCWCVTAPPEALLEEAETAYRTTWRAETGTEVTGDLADACAGWLIRGDALVERAHRGTVDHLARVPDHDWTWGTVTARQRLAHRLGVVARMTAEHDALGALSRLSTELRERLLTRWPALTPPPSRRPR